MLLSLQQPVPKPPSPTSCISGCCSSSFFPKSSHPPPLLAGSGTIQSLLPTAASFCCLPSESACVLPAFSHDGMRPTRSTAHSKSLAELQQPAGFGTCLLAIYDPAVDRWQPVGLDFTRNRQGCDLQNKSRRERIVFGKHGEQMVLGWKYLVKMEIGFKTRSRWDWEFIHLGVWYTHIFTWLKDVLPNMNSC